MAHYNPFSATLDQPDLNQRKTMSEARTNSDDSTNLPPRPGSEGTESSTVIPPAYDLALEDINPINPHLWSQHRWTEYFERLRAEDPVHFNQTDLAGRYWSLTKYEDIKKVDADWQNFSSAQGIVLGLPIDAELPEGALGITTFIAQDPPEHDDQRRAVTPGCRPAQVGGNGTVDSRAHLQRPGRVA